MKRYISFDFLRGVAIIGVLCFHMLNVLYNYEAALANNPPIPYYLLIIFLYYVGQFDILFMTLSGVVNTISIDKQWQKSITPETTEGDRKKVASKILKSQIIRGLFIFLMAYISEGFLNGTLITIIVNDPNETVADAIVGSFYYTNVLMAIALSVIVSGVVYTALLAKGLNRQKMTRILLYCMLFLFAITPFMSILSHQWPMFHEGSWQDRSFGLNFLYFFLAPIFRRGLPFFPYGAFGFLGAIVGTNISEGKFTKSMTNRWAYSSILFFIAGFLLYAIKIADLELMGNIKYFVESLISLGEICMVTGGALLAMLVLVYLIDVRGKGKTFAKYTIWIRRFGLLSLTLWAIQWVLAIQIRIYQAIYDAITGSTVPFLEGRFYNGGLSGWEYCFWAFISMLFFVIILKLWEKVNFAGSFEWLTVKLLSRGRADAGDRLDLKASLYGVESIVTEGQSYYGFGTRLGLWGIFFAMDILYVAVSLFL